MKLISCDNCATVLDYEKLEWPHDLWNEGGESVNLDVCEWDGDRFVAIAHCPVCNDTIRRESDE